ncbi:DNA polymerase-4 [Ruminococcaceae bacterium YRB3002]|nr:DNA polymerase-4 [Ruminococcaceae bacterium YRB3002]
MGLPQMRTILHSDMNNCFASIELLHRPELRGHPMAVGGDPEARHGIVLAKDMIAKKAGVKTGMALWQARQVCPDIVFVPPRMDLYLRFSRMAHEIYADYTDLQEPFGIDESWLDVTASTSIKGEGPAIAEDIRRRMKEELGVTVSIGVSWNKIYAKFGSDYKKPDAVTVITPENYRDIVWPMPVEDLLYVGRSTNRRLRKVGITTVGKLAESDPEFLHSLLGKMGYVLRMFARGEDNTPVSREDYRAPLKSIGNSTTAPRDLVNMQDVKIIIYVLAESVGARLRENGFKCNVVEIWVRDNELASFVRQKRVPRSTNITSEIARAAMELFAASYDWHKPVRSIGVRACSFVDASMPEQLDIFTDEAKRDKQHVIDCAIDEIRGRFGFDSIRRGLMNCDPELSGLNAKEDNTVHPHSYFESGNRTGVEDVYG